MKAVQVLFDEPLLARLDADPEVRKAGRSAVLRRAAAETCAASAVNLDHVQTVEQSRLVRRLGHLAAPTMRDICRALAIAAGCAD